MARRIRASDHASDGGMMKHEWAAREIRIVRQVLTSFNWKDCGLDWAQKRAEDQLRTYILAGADPREICHDIAVASGYAGFDFESGAYLSAAAE
jgi:hypothetical protein